MLANAETKAILIYIQNLLNSRKMNFTLKYEFCKWANENDALFYRSKTDQSQCESSDFKRKETLETFTAFKNAVILQLEKLNDTPLSSFEKTLASLSSLFRLNTVETKALALLIRIGKYEFLEELFHR